MVILISNGEQWTRKHDSNFDVTMALLITYIVIIILITQITYIGNYIAKIYK